MQGILSRQEYKKLLLLDIKIPQRCSLGYELLHYHFLVVPILGLERTDDALNDRVVPIERLESALCRQELVVLIEPDERGSPHCLVIPIESREDSAD